MTEYWLADPQRAIELQASLGRAYLELWALRGQAARRRARPPAVAPDPRDKRFADPEWSQNQFFDFLKQAYLLTAKWAEKLVKDAEVDPHTRQKAEFYVRQITNALSPSNFLLTNPELMRETHRVQRRKSRARHAHARRGHPARRRQSQDPAVRSFDVRGRPQSRDHARQGHLSERADAAHPIRGDDREVLKTPLLIVPPWINKFYILDLTPEKSFIKWCVEQGITVFVISWVNPDASVARKSFEEYMREGVIAAVDAVDGSHRRKARSTPSAIASAARCSRSRSLGSRRRSRTASSRARCSPRRSISPMPATSRCSSTRSASRIWKSTWRRRAIWKASRMATAFNMLRSNDLVWPYVVNNYLRGKKPYPFDILYWNSDATRMPAANHSFYLRNCYLENKLAKGEMEIAGVTLDLKKVKVPIYNLATREDHIAPAKSVLYGSQFFGGDVKYVLAGSGHIAGVVNPPAKPKYQYWTGGPPKGSDVDAWVAKATEHPGSWWPDWLAWLKSHDAATVPARKIGGGKLNADRRRAGELM